MSFEIKVVGRIHSTLKEIKHCPLQEYEDAPKAIIEIYSEYTKSAKDIKTGDELLLLTWLHLADRSVFSTYPRNDDRNPLTGVFSTRSPDRPNPIGVHVVKVIALIDSNMIEVSALEVLDQTPLLDIKPTLLHR